MTIHAGTMANGTRISQLSHWWRELRCDCRARAERAYERARTCLRCAALRGATRRSAASSTINSRRRWLVTLGTMAVLTGEEKSKREAAEAALILQSVPHRRARAPIRIQFPPLCFSNSALASGDAVCFQMNSTIGVESVSPCGWCLTPGLAMRVIDPPRA